MKKGNPKRKKKQKGLKVTKALCERWHAKKRCLERYGINLNREGYLSIIKTIQTGRSKLLWKQSLAKFHYSVNYEDTQFIVVYDRNRKELVTFLPKDAEYTDKGIVKWI